MSLKNFIFSKVFIKNLGLAVVFAIGLVIVTLIWLNFYTRHGQARPVPDFTGLSVGEARELAGRNKLRFQIIDSIYTSEVPRGTIAEQSPEPGFRVKKKRNVMLTINAFKPEMVAMPDLVDMSMRQASRVLESSGLVMGSTRFKPDISVNMVIEQYYRGRHISPGDSIQKGSEIDLVLGSGLSNERTNIPNLLGLDLQQARNRIMEASLVLGTYNYDKTVSGSADSARAVVYKQNPEYRIGATVPLGSDIYLWLSTDPSMIRADSASLVSGTASAQDSLIL